MGSSALPRPSPAPPSPRAILALLKPITWFPPMWAFLCGIVSSGAALSANAVYLLAGLMLTGPLVCGASQAVNDWFDRHVDAINEPGRPIPSGQVAGTWGLRIAILGTAVSLLVAALVGPWILAATLLALACGWAYSAPPFRFKANGWLGPAVCALSYEGLTWFTGASIGSAGLPRGEILIVLLLYSLGAHGIMVLNDFKAVVGDARTGLRSLPVTLGAARAARLACLTMAAPQALVVALLWRWQLELASGIVGVLLIAQCVLMPRLLRNAAAMAPWYAARGVGCYVLGMLAAALGLGGYLP